MKLENLPLIPIEQFDTYGEALVTTRAELIHKPNYPNHSVRTSLVYVAGLLFVPGTPDMFDERFLICSEGVTRYIDGTAVIPLSLQSLLRHEHPQVKSIIEFTPFEISGASFVSSPHWERFDPRRDYQEE